MLEPLSVTFAITHIDQDMHRDGLGTVQMGCIHQTHTTQVLRVLCIVHVRLTRLKIVPCRALALIMAMSGVSRDVCLERKGQIGMPLYHFHDEITSLDLPSIATNSAR